MEDLTGLLYVISNNQFVGLANNALNRSGRDITAGWVFETGAVVKMVGYADGSSLIEMIHPLVVSERYVSLEKFNQTFAGLSLQIAPGTISIVVRHGYGYHNDPFSTTDEGHDAPLTILGEKQALDAAKAILADKDFQQVRTFKKAHGSDLLRTLQTCEIITGQFPPEFDITQCHVCIESHETIRAIGEEHYWQSGHPLREIAMNPFLPLDTLSVLAPKKSRQQLEKMVKENQPKNDPIENPDACIKFIGKLRIDWSDYVAKLEKAKIEGETFGQAASKKQLLDVILETAIDAVRK